MGRVLGGATSTEWLMPGMGTAIAPAPIRGWCQPGRPIAAIGAGRYPEAGHEAGFCPVPGDPGRWWLRQATASAW